MNKSEGQIMDALSGAGGPFSAPAHAVLRGVRNKTGHSGASERYADGIVVSLYPSRGVWFAGVEVKVSRSDWMRELKDPDKSVPIQRFCAYWWIAAPPGIVKADELPPTWGLIEVSAEGKCKRVKPAPLLEPEAPTVAFVASVMRSADGAATAAFRRGCDETHRKYTDAAARIREAETSQKNAEAKLAQALRDGAHEKEALADAMAVIDLAGVRGDMWRMRYSNDDDKAAMAQAIRQAVRLRDKRDEIERMAASFRACADDLAQAASRMAS